MSVVKSVPAGFDPETADNFEDVSDLRAIALLPVLTRFQMEKQFAVKGMLRS